MLQLQIKLNRQINCLISRNHSRLRGKALDALARWPCFKEPADVQTNNSMQIPANINNRECNCWAIWTDKQGQRRDKVHLTLYTVLSTKTMSKATGPTRYVWVCLFLCVCVWQNHSGVLPQASQISSVIILVIHQTLQVHVSMCASPVPPQPPTIMSIYLFLLLFHSCALFPVGLSKRNSQEAEGNANLYIVEGCADGVRAERKKAKF